MQDILLATESEDVSASGAVSITTPVTYLTVSGTKAYTLADGPTGIAGMRKRIECVSAASTPLGTLTIASPETTSGLACSSTFLFDTVGQAIELQWTGTKWRATRVQRAGGTANNVVVGTTVLTGINLWANYYLSVTGTVSSTVAANRGLPNGSAVGEIVSISCTTAASTPNGTFEMVRALPSTGAVGTGNLNTINATTAVASFFWRGDAWVLIHTVTAAHA